MIKKFVSPFVFALRTSWGHDEHTKFCVIRGGTEIAEHSEHYDAISYCFLHVSTKQTAQGDFCSDVVYGPLHSVLPVHGAHTNSPSSVLYTYTFVFWHFAQVDAWFDPYVLHSWHRQKLPKLSWSVVLRQKVQKYVNVLRICSSGASVRWLCWPDATFWISWTSSIYF